MIAHKWGQRLAVAALALIIAFVGLFPLYATAPASVLGAPAAAPTPIAQYARNAEPMTVAFWDAATGLTADTRSACFDVSGYSTLDLHYVIDQGTVNTTTLKLQFSNISGAYVDGIAVVTANAADTSGLVQYNLFGRSVCLYADVVNANSWSVRAVGVVK